MAVDDVALMTDSGRFDKVWRSTVATTMRIPVRLRCAAIWAFDRVRVVRRLLPWWAGPVLVIVLLGGGALFAFDRTGVLDISDDKSAGDRFTAAFAFVGLLISTMVGLVTVAINRQGEKRQAVDSSLRAIGLLARADGEPSDPSVAGGALLALSSLGQVELAVALLSYLWPQDLVTGEAAMALIDKALRGTDRDTREDAAFTLHTNSEHLWIYAESTDDDSTYCYPNSLYYRWDPSYAHTTKQILAESWIYFWSTSPTDFPGRLRALLLGLNEMWRRELNPALRNSVGILLQSAIDADEFSGSISWTVRGRPRVIDAHLSEDIRRWRRRRKTHKREIPPLVALAPLVVDMVEDDAVERAKAERRRRARR